MVVFSTVGLLANLIALGLLRRGQAESLNLRGAYLEVLGDLLSSAGVVVTALIIWLTGWHWADSVVSIAIALFIAPRAWHLLNEALRILLEATPRGLDLSEVRRHLQTHPNVVDVHDLHAWTITSGMPVLSAHVVVEDSVCRQRTPPARLHDRPSTHFPSTTPPSKWSRWGTPTTRTPAAPSPCCPSAAPAAAAHHRKGSHNGTFGQTAGPARGAHPGL